MESRFRLTWFWAQVTVLRLVSGCFCRVWLLPRHTAFETVGPVGLCVSVSRLYKEFL